MEEAMLTTIDNPWSPFTHWDEWLSYDTAAGYYTPALLGRVVRSSDELSEVDDELSINYAIDEIIRENVSGVHVKVYRDSPRIVELEKNIK